MMRSNKKSIEDLIATDPPSSPTKIKYKKYGSSKPRHRAPFPEKALTTLS